MHQPFLGLTAFVLRSIMSSVSTAISIFSAIFGVIVQTGKQSHALRSCSCLIEHGKPKI
jgi:hypothetical protein